MTEDSYSAHRRGLKQKQAWKNLYYFLHTDHPQILIFVGYRYWKWAFDNGIAAESRKVWTYLSEKMRLKIQTKNLKKVFLLKYKFISC